MKNVARIKEQSSTAGLSSFELASSGALYRRLRDEFASGERVRYYAASASDFEEGVGVITYGTPDTLSRDTILRSSQSGAKINWPAGTRDIFVDPLPGSHPISDKAGSYTVTFADLGSVLRFTGTTATLTLPAAAGVGDGFSLELRNDGSGAVTIDPNGSETIDGSTTIAIGAGDWAVIRTNGVAWYTLRPNVNALAEDTAPDRAADFAMIYDASAGVQKKAKLNKLGGLSVAVIADQKTSGTSGGSFSSGSWATRTLQTEISDPDGIVSISSNQFTLQAGTYLIEAVAPAYQVAEHQARLQNITDAATVAVGTSERSGGASQTSTSSVIRAVVTIAGAKAFEIQHQCVSTNATNGFGAANSFGTQQYTTVTISKLA